MGSSWDLNPGPSAGNQKVLGSITSLYLEYFRFPYASSYNSRTEHAIGEAIVSSCRACSLGSRPSPSTCVFKFMGEGNARKRGRPGTEAIERALHILLVTITARNGPLRSHFYMYMYMYVHIYTCVM